MSVRFLAQFTKELSFRCCSMFLFEVECTHSSVRMLRTKTVVLCTQDDLVYKYLSPDTRSAVLALFLSRFLSQNWTKTRYIIMSTLKLLGARLHAELESTFEKFAHTICNVRLLPACNITRKGEPFPAF